MQGTAERTLHQVFTEDGDDPTAGTQVQKPQELQEAVESGDVYIEITEHLDLRRLSPSEGSNFLLSVGLNGTISIRVRFQLLSYAQRCSTSPGCVYLWRYPVAIAHRCIGWVWCCVTQDYQLP